MVKSGVLAFGALIVVASMLLPLPVFAQAGQSVISMRTPDGHPDVSGVFTFRTLTPLQRPVQFAGRENLTAEEAATFESSERTRQNRDLFDPEIGAPNAGYRPRAECGVLSYNEFGTSEVLN